MNPNEMHRQMEIPFVTYEVLVWHDSHNGLPEGADPHWCPMMMTTSEEDAMKAVAILHRNEGVQARYEKHEIPAPTTLN